MRGYKRLLFGLCVTLAFIILLPTYSKVDMTESQPIFNEDITSLDGLPLLELPQAQTPLVQNFLKLAKDYIKTYEELGKMLDEL